MPTYMQNRELSWIRFNERVLAEAADESVPLLERLKFLSIFTSNLDEFFMIRVGSLFDLQSVNAGALDSKTGMTPKEQLDKLYASVHPLIKKRDEVYFNLERKLRGAGVFNLSIAELSIEEYRFVRKYYEQEIAPILSPQIVDSHHPFPHLQNKVLHIGVMLKEGEKSLFGVIPVPQSLPDIVRIPGKGLRYIRIEEIILDNVETIFSMYR
ncbi:MAG TPA: RNA degradosome polyphosphate kinase, partial [Methanocorpusculum sp.]|nr:RNA degradosome polyphosphate kinase [Methanocorpusculum sp.]